MVRRMALILVSALISGGKLRPPATVECMVARADAIVLAKFKGGSDRRIYRDRLGDLYLANFDHVAAFKGWGIESLEFEEYSLLWRKGSAEYPYFSPGKVYILYLKYSDIGPYILNGSRGAIEVNRETMKEVSEITRSLGKPPSKTCADS